MKQQTKEKGELIHYKNNLIQHSKNIEEFLVKRQKQFINIFLLQDKKKDFKYNQKVYSLSPQENILRIGLLSFKLNLITTEYLQKMLNFAKRNERSFFYFVKNNFIKHSKNIEQFLVKRQKQFIKIFQLQDKKEDFKYNQKVYSLSPQENILRIGLLQFKLNLITTEFLQKMLNFAKQNEFSFMRFVNGLQIRQQALKDLKFYNQIFQKIRTLLNSRIFFSVQLKKMIKEIQEINFINLTRLYIDLSLDNYQFFTLIDFSKVKGFQLVIRGFGIKSFQKIFLPELENINLRDNLRNDHCKISQIYIFKTKNSQNNKKKSNFLNFSFVDQNDLGHLIKSNQDFSFIKFFRKNHKMMAKTIQMIKQKINLLGLDSNPFDQKIQSKQSIIKHNNKVIR